MNLIKLELAENNPLALKLNLIFMEISHQKNYETIKLYHFEF